MQAMIFCPNCLPCCFKQKHVDHILSLSVRQQQHWMGMKLRDKIANSAYIGSYFISFGPQHLKQQCPDAFFTFALFFSFLEQEPEIIGYIKMFEHKPSAPGYEKASYFGHWPVDSSVPCLNNSQSQTPLWGNLRQHHNL